MTINHVLSFFQTRKENQDQSDLDGLASCSSDDELERQQKRKARARNKKVKMNYAFDFVLSVDVKYFLHF